MISSVTRPTWVASLAVTAAASSGLLFLRTYGVDVPLDDEWDIVPPLWEAARNGTLDLQVLARPHNEHRILVPRLVYLGFVWTMGWNTIALMLLTQALLLFSAATCARLVRDTISAEPSRLLMPLGLGLLLLYSPAQSETLLMGLEFHLATPAACLIAIIWIARRRWSLAPTLLVAAILASTATFSLANGLLCWLLAPLVVWATPRPRSRGQGLWLSVWILLGAFHIWLYATGLHGVPKPFAVGVTQLRPLHVMQALCAFIGRPLALVETWPPAPNGAIAIGACALVVLTALATWLACEWRHAALVERAMPWVALTLYGLGSGVLAVFARAGSFVWMTMANRYVTVSVWILIGLIMLAALWREHARERRGRLSAAAAPAWCALCVAVAVLYALALPVELGRADETRRAHLRGRAAIAFADVVTTFPAVLHPEAPTVPSILPRLQANGLLTKPRAAVRWEASRQDDLSCRYGAVTNAQWLSAGRLDLAGWAFLPADGRPADAVVVTSGIGSQPRPLAVGFPAERRLDVEERLQAAAARFSGWHLQSGVAGSTDGMRAWAFDAASGRAYPLCGRFEPAADTVGGR